MQRTIVLAAVALVLTAQVHAAQEVAADLRASGTNIEMSKSASARVESWIDGAYVSCGTGSAATDAFVSHRQYGSYGPTCVDGSTIADQGNTPIIVPTGISQEFPLTSPADGVNFDLDADGLKERTAWTERDADLAFLALDRNGNGMIDDGSELFGNHTLPGALDGFEALMKIDTLNGIPSAVDYDDPVYPKLLLWQDRNHNGVSEPDELRPASELLTKIGLGSIVVGRQDRFGNRLHFKGWAVYRTGPGRNEAANHGEELRRQRDIYDVILQNTRRGLN